MNGFYPLADFFRTIAGDQAMRPRECPSRHDQSRRLTHAVSTPRTLASTSLHSAARCDVKLRLRDFEGGAEQEATQHRAPEPVGRHDAGAQQGERQVRKVVTELV